MGKIYWIQAIINIIGIIIIMNGGDVGTVAATHRNEKSYSFLEEKNTNPYRILLPENYEPSETDRLYLQRFKRFYLDKPYPYEEDDFKSSPCRSSNTRKRYASHTSESAPTGKMIKDKRVKKASANIDDLERAETLLRAESNNDNNREEIPFYWNGNIHQGYQGRIINNNNKPEYLHQDSIKHEVISESIPTGNPNHHKRCNEPIRFSLPLFKPLSCNL